MTHPGQVRRSSIGWRSRGGRRLMSLLGPWGLAIALIGCVGSGASPTPSPAVVPSTTPPGSPAAGPLPTNWPSNVIEAAIELAAADAGFAPMNKDVADAVTGADPRTMLTVMTDSLTFLQANQRSIPALQAYALTKDLGDKLAAAYGQMIRGAQAIVGGLRSGDGESVQQGFNDFFAGGAAYAPLTGPLGDLASHAALMKKHLVQ